MAASAPTQAPAAFRRPTVVTAEVRREILDRLADGESLRGICADERMPSRQTIYRLVNTNEEFRAQFEAARWAGLEALADDLVAIADDSREDPQRSKLMLESRKWVLSKMLPKKFGDRVSAELSGPDGSAIKVEDLSTLEVARRLAFVLAQGQQIVREGK